VKDILSLKGLWGEEYKVKLENLRRNVSRFSNDRAAIFGLILVTLVSLVAIFAPYIAPYPTDATHSTVDFTQSLQPPSFSHPFGTDQVGRDILSRVIFGSRIALKLGLVIIGLSTIVGVPLGLLAGLWEQEGFVRNFLSATIMRLTDLFISIPRIVMAFAISAILGPSLINAMIAVTVVSWPWYCRITYGEAVNLKKEPYVESAIAAGSGRFQIAFKHILSNSIPPLLVKITMDMGFAILIAATLSFVGLGVQPPTPAWGTMMSQARKFLPSYIWTSIFPGFAVFFTVLGFNLLGDGLSEVLNVKSTR